MRSALFAFIVALAGCGGGGGANSTPMLAGPAANGVVPGSEASTPAPHASPQPTAPPDAPGHTNVVPPLPAAGKSRTGEIYNIYITSPTGDTVAFTVFEPGTLTGGKTYPLVFHGHGFGASRTTSLSSSPSPTSPITGTANTGGNIPPLVAANYGVISFDQTGMGETSGTIRSMDPDHEGKDVLAVLDWAQAKLGWLAYGPTLDGRDSHEPIYGAIGGSYGGMYQYMLLNIDPRHRLHAIVPQIAPSNLNYALYPNGVIKAEWDSILFGLGNQAGSGTQRLHYDPFLFDSFTSDFANNAEDAYTHDFFAYHSSDYFCNGTSIATNGGAGTSPKHPPTTRTPLINAMIWIGVRDTLFNFNNGYTNYRCLQRAGGDVRLLSYQAGHNSANLIVDAGLANLPQNDQEDTRCGHLTEDAATLAFFAQYLKGQSGAAGAIPTQPCISLSAGDGIVVPQVTTGSGGTAYSVGSLPVVAGAQSDVPTASGTLVTGGPQGTVVAGIPHAVIDVEPVGGVAVGEPIVFVGLGVMHAAHPGLWDLVDNQPTPLRGVGRHDLDLGGGGVRLAPGDKLAFVAYGLQDQYVFSGSVNGAKPAVVPVTISGTVSIPVLGTVPSNI